MIKSTEDRLRREKDFHNKTFSSDSRKAVKKYYMSANTSKEFHRSMLLEGIKAKKVLEYEKDVVLLKALIVHSI